MVQQIINTGTVPNDGTGDPLQTAFIKCNANFSDLYAKVLAIAPTGAAGVPLANNGAGGFSNAPAWNYTGNGLINTQSLGAVSADGLVLQNSTAAALGAQQFSPRLRWRGQGWETNTSASQPVDWIAELQPAQGTTNPSGNLVFSAQINGGGYASVATLSSSGGITLTGGAQTASNPVLTATQTWNNAGTTFSTWLFNVTNTASAAGSALMQLQIGGVDRFRADIGQGSTPGRSDFTISAVAFTDLAVLNFSQGGAQQWNYYADGSQNFNIQRVGGGVVASFLASGTSVKLTSGVVLNWNADVGISRVAAGVVAVGGGTPGDASATVTAAIFESLKNNIGTTSSDGVDLFNSASAALGAQQFSPRVHWQGQGWETNTSASQTVDWIAELQPVQGAANPSSNLVFSSQVNGGGYTAGLTLKSLGQVVLGATTYAVAAPHLASAVSATTGFSWSGTGVYISSGGVSLAAFTNNSLAVSSASLIGFSSTTIDTTGVDSAFSRTSAGVLALGNGTVNDTSGTLHAKFVLSPSPSGGIGYMTGSGGTVTQLTSKATGVTLSTVSGQITMNNASLAAGAVVSFVLTNTAIAATDTLIVHHISGGTLGAYSVTYTPAAGSATIFVTNRTAGALAEAIVLQFTVIKSTTA